jgi:hypothetical protein
MKEEPNCKYKVKRGAKKMNICRLGLYGGRVSDGGCKICMARGENTPEFAQALSARAEQSHPSSQRKISGCCDSARNYTDRI